MFSPRRLSTLLFILIFLGLSAKVFSQTSTFTATRTPTKTRTSTATRTPSSTPTDTRTPTISPTATNSFTPNPSLTPLCGSVAGSFGVTTALNSLPGASNTMRASLATLSKAATVQSLWIFSGDNGAQVMTGIYTGSTGNIGSLIVQSAPQTLAAGWNGFLIPPTVLTSGTYWLAYCYNAGSYTAYDTTTAGVSVLAYTSAAVTFPNMPGTMPGTPAYGTNADSIYAVFCPQATSTPTPSFTPTDTFTATITPTPTATGTIMTNTPTVTNTSTFTLTPTVTWTWTYSATPNLSLTPVCGAAATWFGSNIIGAAPQTLGPSNGVRGCRYYLNQSGTVQTISIYLPSQDAGKFFMEVALYADDPSTATMTNLLGQSTTQITVDGWNTFSIPATYLAPSYYWADFVYAGAVSNLMVILPNYTGTASNTFGFISPVASWTLPNSFAGVVTQYGANYFDPIMVNYCPGTLNSPTPTNSPTNTFTGTPSGTPTVTSTWTNTISPTPTGTSTLTGTWTPSGTPSNTGTPTFTWTITDTPTMTWTPTITNSPTDSPTWTFSMTPTMTGTPTLTPTLTPTATSSSTPTATFTSTPSGTPTFTLTSTATLTVTQTPNLTWSPTSTPTVTLTSTPSSTATLTPSYSPTFSNTPSGTPSSTPTSTKTSTQTVTSSSTGTATATSSWTQTWTPTLSPTATPSSTPTQSPTWTPTPGCSIAKSVSQNVANPNDILTYNIALTVVGGPVTNLSVTDTLPSAMDLVGFGTVPPGGTTSWNASTKTLGWSTTLLPPGSYFMTYQVQVTTAAQPGQVLTNNAQLTYLGLSAPLTSSANVAMAATVPVLYPNPIKDQGPAILQVILAQPQEEMEVKVFTTAFRKVYGDRLQNLPAGAFQYALDPARFEGGEAANGLYYVLIKTSSNRWVLKLLITR